MPTNLLMWNVQFFSSAKISMIGAADVDLVDIKGNKADFIYDKVMNLEYITSNIRYKHGDLLDGAHLFVLIENLSAQGTTGSLAQGNGADGALLMLNGIRTNTYNRNWMLVPPLKLVNRIQVEEADTGEVALLREGAYTECISVFYRSDLLDFVGPYVWPAAGDNDDPTKTAQKDSGQARGAYPDPWAGALPAGNHFAGQFQYFGAGGEVLFPAEGSRRPFFTQFREKTGGKRLISLVSVHFPPHFIQAREAFVRTLSLFSEANHPLQDNEVLLIGGDLNLDYLSDELLLGEYLYNAAARDHFTLALDKTRRGSNFGPTIIKRARDATLRNYLGKKGYDNIAYRSKPAIDPLVAVYDRVNGTQPSMMFNTPAELATLLSPEPQNRTFRLPQNYAHMGPVPGVSDHLPVFMSF